MPALVNGSLPSKKRKKDAKEILSAKRRAVANGSNDAVTSKVQELENQISESRQHYNNVATLISMLDVANPGISQNVVVAVSLCRIFSRLMAAGSLSKRSQMSDQESIIVSWLNARYLEYQDALLNLLRHGDFSTQDTALTLQMQLIKSEGSHLTGHDEAVWTSGFFSKLLLALYEVPDGQDLRNAFLTRYFRKYDEIRFYTFIHISDYASTDRSTDVIDNIISLMSEVADVPSSADDLRSFYVDPPKKDKHPLRSLTAHKRRAQEAWLAILRSGLTPQQRKTLLRLTTSVIVPWLLKSELLMDFLTDSYNHGGATSHLALSGLFHLIQEKNLDYPQFYPKLYSLLNADLLHSKHRSRFFRLLDTFLSSTHLPAALVASFIKRLSRLALHAPPAGIVAVIPWVYNLLKSHPACTFMIHRTISSPEMRAELASEGMDDPFSMSESDPMLTNAIQSNLWEIETLQSHYHPNVAALARIISEQFTKPAYNLEDFLDHSYQSMLDAELGKVEVKMAPVVEYKIPKRIFTETGVDDGKEEGLLRRLWDFS